MRGADHWDTDQQRDWLSGVRNQLLFLPLLPYKEQRQQNLKHLQSNV
jgi:hypothetical protein